MTQQQFSRRNFLRGVGMAGMALGAGRRAAAAGKKPNVLFIAVDDLNDWTGCLGGHPDAKTPNIDRLVGRGTLFNHAYCAAPACNPSRAALMTGIRPATSGVYLNEQRWRDSAVLKGAITLPQHFMDHGYTALASGKIYHGSFPDAASWDDYWPSQEKNKPGDPMPPEDQLPLNGFKRKSHFDWGPVDAPKEEMGDWQVAEWISEQLGRDFDKPFFLACGFYRPHLPWYAPREYFDKFPLDSLSMPEVPEDDLEDVPAAGVKMAKPDGDHANVLQYGQWRRAVQAYLACINFVDDCLGRVVDALDQSAYRDNTIVVLWSDHGWHLGEKLHWRKFSLWEEATHNMLAFVAPGITDAGGRCDAPVNLLDIYPTLCELAGLPVREELEGMSLAPLLRDPAKNWEIPALTTHGKENHTVRSARWRYIRYADGSEELYDHDRDEMEWKNLAGDPEYASVKAAHAQWLPKKNVPYDPPRKK